MAWLDRLLRGSFRGAPFRIQAHEAAGGARRVALHEYPGRDVPYAEDLGRKATEFKVNAYVVGDDYQLERELLVAACGRAGPGILVHPYLGVRRVACTGLKVSESTREGRMARIEMTFVEAGANELPLAILNPATLVAEAVTAAQGAVGEAFAEAFGL